MEDVLAAAGIALERVHHGDGAASWAVNARALERGHGVRTGVEDTHRAPGRHAGARQCRPRPGRRRHDELSSAALAYFVSPAGLVWVHRVRPRRSAAKRLLARRGRLLTTKSYESSIMSLII
jgi:hypothetical protein